MLKIFVGWDSREDVAYQVCRSSILRRASIPVEVIPLKQHELRERGIYTRSADKLSSTEFTFTRFLVPYLSEYSGWSVFCDCDFLWNCDAKEILEICNSSYSSYYKPAVMVAKHRYVPNETIKMDGKVQHLYPRKNWSSMIVWNCEHPANMMLTPDLVNAAAGSTLHQFKWIKDEDICDLGYQYNWLEGWYKEPQDGEPKIIHYTRGNVYFKDYQDVEYGDLWKEEFKHMTGQDWTDDMILNKAL